MSSGVQAGGGVAMAVTLPAAVVFGTVWFAWRGGKLLSEANNAVDKQIALKKKQLEEEAILRKKMALSAHNQLVDMCSQILSQLETRDNSVSIDSLSEIEQLKYELKLICNESLPNDVMRIESITSLGYLKLVRIVQQHSQIAAMTMTNSDTVMYKGVSVADLMDDIRLTIETMSIQETKGTDVNVANPEVLERKILNEEFLHVTSEIMAALENVHNLSSTYRLSESGSAWFHSCFNGIDIQIESLCRSTVSNQDLKKGIRRLRSAMEQYELMASNIEEEQKRMEALYNVYVDAAKALGEKTESFKSFKGSSELEEKLIYLKQRAIKAQECAEIYKKLGHAAYLCYAWDQELKAMGYEVHSRNEIAEMAGIKPIHAKIEENKIPFYVWNGTDLTQLYSISSQCSMQLIINEDGSISMQTFAEAEGEGVVRAQRFHCSQLEVLRERLRQNWFVLYDYSETESPEKITTIDQWSATNVFSWGADIEDISPSDKRKVKRKKKEKNKYNSSV